MNFQITEQVGESIAQVRGKRGRSGPERWRMTNGASNRAKQRVPIGNGSSATGCTGRTCRWRQQSHEHGKLHYVAGRFYGSGLRVRAEKEIRVVFRRRIDAAVRRQSCLLVFAGQRALLREQLIAY